MGLLKNIEQAAAKKLKTAEKTFLNTLNEMVNKTPYLNTEI